MCKIAQNKSEMKVISQVSDDNHLCINIIFYRDMKKS